MLYLLGLSYGAVSLALDSLGVALSKTCQPVEKRDNQLLLCWSSASSLVMVVSSIYTN